MSHEKALNSLLKNKAAGIPAPVLTTGDWINDYKSIAKFEVTGNDVSGSYTSQVSEEPGGGSVTGTISGYTSGNVVSFSVLWPDGSITTWMGHLVKPTGGGLALKTLWYLGAETKDPEDPNEVWESVLAGADNFTPVVAP